MRRLRFDQQPLLLIALAVLNGLALIKLGRILGRKP
jgi:hypothetical protein